MSAIAKIIGGVTAAAAIGGGVYLTTTPASTQDSPDALDDVAAASVELPKVALPVVTLPADPTVKVTVPEVSGETVVSAYDAAQYGLTLETVETAGVSSASVSVAAVQNGSATVYRVTCPSGLTVTVQSSAVAAIIAAVPELAQAAVDNPQITAAEIIRKLVSVPDITAGDIQKVLLALPKVTDPAARIPLVQELMKVCKTLFKDQRGITYDKTVSIDNAALAGWIQIYQRNEAYSLEYVKLPPGLRMIAEIHYPIDAAVLDKNLEYYADQGYNAVLISFGYGNGETLGGLMDLASYVKSKGMQAWFAYAGPESLTHSVFMEPSEYARWLSRLAAVCDGFLLGWRRTSLHLFLQDRPWVAYTLKNVRLGNPRIPVLGEVYFGQTAASNENTVWLTHNIPANASGAMIFGFGFGNVSADIALSRLRKIKEMDRVSVIIGDKPYYATRNDNRLGFEENQKIKAALEARWIKAGCTGTITLHGDGSDGNYDKRHTDNIAKTEVTR